MNKTQVDWDTNQDLFEKLIEKGFIGKSVIEEIYKISHEFVQEDLTIYKKHDTEKQNQRRTY